MKFTVVAMFIAFYAAFGVESKSVEESSEKPTGHRSRINSGDTIALRSAFTFGFYSTKWLKCTKASCVWTSCRGTDIDSTEWASCPERMMFAINLITAKGEKEGGAIKSGDRVSLSPIKYLKYGQSFSLGCGPPDSSTKCCVRMTSSKMRGDNSYATFQIFSRDAADGSPVKNSDVVDFKLPQGSNNNWLTYYQKDGHFYSCSSESKKQKACAAENKFTGFVIFKKL